VTDQGPGVPLSERERIFDRFYRSPAAAAETAGTGLGLALVRHFAQAHGGHAEVRDGDDRGSTFVLAIPKSTDGQDSHR
jgi:signal transduction histidine kinase